MKTLTKIEILAGARMLIKDGFEWVTVNRAELAMQSFSEQENARLMAINEKQAELIKRFLKGNLQIPIRDYSLYQKLNDELFSLQAGEEKEEDKYTCQIADKGSHSNFCKRCKKHTY